MNIKKRPSWEQEGSNDCLPYKKSYLLAALSAGAAALESAGIVAVVSVGATVLLSTVEVDESTDSFSVALSPHAAKAPIAKTKRSFFILPVFVLNE
jgi:hypothetical protein